MISILKFCNETIKYVFNKNEAYFKWPESKMFLDFYEEVPEHTSAINFLLANIATEGVETLDMWTVKKLTLDYLIFGGFTVEVLKTRGGGFILNYLDISKVRYNPDKNKLGYADNWETYKVDIKWSNITDSVNKEGIFIFKNPVSRHLYPTPHYYSASIALDTMKEISEYHNNNAKNGFTPTAVINFNNGEPDLDTKRQIEKDVREKFTGSKGQKFILSFNSSPDTKTTIERLEDDNLDAKFELLQKFLQNQIIVSHQITSPQLIGIKADNQGFSKTEYEEAFSIFEDTIVKGYIDEIKYGLSKLFNKEINITNIKKEEVVK